MFPYHIDIESARIDVFGRPDSAKLVCINKLNMSNSIAFVFSSGDKMPLTIFADVPSAMRVLQKFANDTFSEHKQSAAAKLTSVSTVDLIRELYKRSAAGDIDAHPADTKPE